MWEPQRRRQCSPRQGPGQNPRYLSPFPELVITSWRIAMCSASASNSAGDWHVHSVSEPLLLILKLIAGWVVNATLAAPGSLLKKRHPAPCTWLPESGACFQKMARQSECTGRWGRHSSGGRVPNVVAGDWNHPVTLTNPCSQSPCPEIPIAFV